jgi:hypothetical protein
VRDPDAKAKALKAKLDRYLCSGEELKKLTRGELTIKSSSDWPLDEVNMSVKNETEK